MVNELNVPTDTAVGSVLDVVIISHNSAKDLPACLDSLAAEGSGVVGRVVVVDNASADGSRAVVQLRPFAEWLPTDVNLGFGGGANRGVAATAASGSPFVAVLNPDTEIEPQALGRMVEVLRRRADLAAVGPLVLVGDGSVYPSARTFPSLIDAAGHAMLGSISPRNPFTRRYIGIGRPDWISGTAMVIRRSAFEQVGGFDEAYFMYVEDVDLCWRWRQAGLMVDKVPEAVIHHAIGGSSEGAPFAMIVAHHRSLWRFALRTTVGWRRVLLPAVAVGLVLRALLITARRIVQHRAPATHH